MARIPYVDVNEHPELTDLISKIRGAREGRLINLYKLLLHSAPVANGWATMGGALRHNGTLDGLCRELAIVRVAVLTSSQYEYTAHVRYAKREGATQEQIDQLDDWHGSDVYDDRLRAALGYADAMTHEVHVPDSVFAAVRSHFDDRELVELTVNIGFYNMVSRFLEAMRIDPEESPPAS